MKKYKADHDLHIHSYLSSCSRDPEQNPGSILKYAEENGLSDICLTDHFWDSTIPGASKWYVPQNYEHIIGSLPLPQSEKVRFHFGCETDLDKYMTLGISPEAMEKMEFIIIPTTHLHMKGFTIDEKDCTIEGRARVYVERLEGVMKMDLPFEKIGIAHLTCPLIAKGDPDDHLRVLDLITDDDYKRIFSMIAEKGAGFELNFPFTDYAGSRLERVMRPYFIAKECGCLFYFGSDAHHPRELAGAVELFNAISDFLGLTEENIFRPFKK